MNIEAKIDDAFNAGLPAARLPYAGTSGRGGSSASAETKAAEDAHGTAARQRAVMNRLSIAGPLGMTTRELGTKEGWHHGQASGALSVLHKTGDIVRLATVRRGKQSVYVLPEHVEGRAVAKHGGKPLKDALNLSADEIDLINSFTERVSRQPADTPMWVSSRSAKALAAILARATGEVR